MRKGNSGKISTSRGMYSKVKIIVKTPKKNGRERRTAPVRFSMQNFLTHFLKFELLFFAYWLNAAFAAKK